MDGDGWYSILSRTARIGERMMNLKANVQPKVGAAHELNAGSASCNRGLYRPRSGTHRCEKKWSAKRATPKAIS